MSEIFAITAEGKTWRGETNQLILGKKQQKYGQSNGEIDFYPVRDIKSGVAVTLTNSKGEQQGNLGDLKKTSSPLGYLPRKHDIMKGSLRIISEEELDQILQVQ